MARFYAGTDPAVTQRETRNRERSRKVAAQGMVLLQNDGVLPLEQPGKIALYGWGARHTVRGGTGSGDVNSRDTVNVEQGLEAAQFEVVSKPWLDRLDAVIAASDAEREKNVEAAFPNGIDAVFGALFGHPTPEEPEITDADISPDTDTAVYVISRNSGEGRDRRVEPGDYLLRQREEDNLKMLAQSYAKLVVILNVGGVMDTRFLRELHGVKAILLMSQAGSMGGSALADVVTGKVNPSGKLTTTWAERYEDYPCANTFAHRNGDLDDEAYSEGIYVGYRYFDTFNVTPAYPFGYGLSYTTFE